MSEAASLLDAYLTCDTTSRDHCLTSVLALDRPTLLSVLYLPPDSEPRFRLYDLLTRLSPDGDELLSHVLDECHDSSDLLSQLAAIQFVHDHSMQDLDSFVALFHENLDNPLLIVSVAEALVDMLAKSPNPLAYADTVAVLVDRAIGDVPDLLGSLPPLARVEPLARFLLDSPPFQAWLLDVPYKPEVRTFNVYMRNLLARWALSPRELLLPPRALISAITNPHAGLRTAAFDHIAIMAGHCIDDLHAVERLAERVADGGLDSTVEEVLARRRAMEALGIGLVTDGGRPGATARATAGLEPELMTI